MRSLNTRTILLALGLWGCGATDASAPVTPPPTPNTGELSSLFVSGSIAEIEAGQRVLVTASAETTTGTAYIDGDVVWQTSNPSAVSVTTTGSRTAILTGVGDGAAVISASLGTVKASTGVTVITRCLNGESNTCGQLAFANPSDGQIYRVRLDGTHLLQLTTASTVNYRPSWSPDGQRIAFISAPKTGSVSDIYLMNADGSGLVRRTFGSGLQSVSWSPDGRTLAVSPEGYYSSDIWLITADDNSQPVHLARDGRSPVWSPDGKQIAFIHVSGDDCYEQVYVMNADGTDGHAITPNDGTCISSVGWAPDGMKLVVAKCWDGCEIVTMRADGFDSRQLIGYPYGTGYPEGVAWSPDGKWVAISLSLFTPKYVVSLIYVPAGGGDPRTIASNGHQAAWRPQ